MVQSWPGQARTIWGDHKRFFDTYYAPFPGYYFTGDGARRDEDGYFWITGRVDDVLNVSGHRFGTAEFEAILTEAPEISEAAVVGFPHAIKGQGVYAYIILAEDKSTMQISSHNSNSASESRLVSWQKVDQFQPATDSPKTRSGKVMRRILRKIAEDVFTNLGMYRHLLIRVSLMHSSKESEKLCKHHLFSYLFFCTIVCHMEGTFYHRLSMSSSSPYAVRKHTLKCPRYPMVDIKFKGIGVGGMAAVFKAYDTSLKIDRALKILKPEFLLGDDVRDRFQTEAVAMANLKHPNIVQIYDLGLEGMTLYIVMSTFHMALPKATSVRTVK